MGRRELIKDLDALYTEGWKSFWSLSLAICNMRHLLGKLFRALYNVCSVIKLKSHIPLFSLFLHSYAFFSESLLELFVSFSVWWAFPTYLAHFVNVLIFANLIFLYIYKSLWIICLLIIFYKTFESYLGCYLLPVISIQLV